MCCRNVSAMGKSAVLPVLRAIKRISFRSRSILAHVRSAMSSSH
jgi:hypothetical protein